MTDIEMIEQLIRELKAAEYLAREYKAPASAIEYIRLALAEAEKRLTTLVDMQGAEGNRH